MAPILLILFLTTLLGLVAAGPNRPNLRRDAKVGEVIPGPGLPSLASLGLTSEDLRDPNFLGMIPAFRVIFNS